MWSTFHAVLATDVWPFCNTQACNCLKCPIKGKLWVDVVCDTKEHRVSPTQSVICLEGKKCVSLCGYTKEYECLTSRSCPATTHTHTHRGLLLKVNLYRERRIVDVLNFEETEIVCVWEGSETVTNGFLLHSLTVYEAPECLQNTQFGVNTVCVFEHGMCALFVWLSPLNDEVFGKRRWADFLSKP